MNQNENIFFWSKWPQAVHRPGRDLKNSTGSSMIWGQNVPVWYFLSVKFPHNWYVFKKSINLKEQRLFQSRNLNDLFLQLSVRISVITSTSKLVSSYWEGVSVYLKSSELWKEEWQSGVKGFKQSVFTGILSFAMQIQWEGLGCYFHV